jgi:CheY-like chemotaxis protein
MISKFFKRFKKRIINSDDTNSSVSIPFIISKVLIVDDVAVNRYILRKYVEKARPDILIDEATNGLSAIKMNTENSYDLIFMDLRMAGIQGIETTKIIKQADSHVLVYATTGQLEKEIIEQCLEAGIKKVFGKPLDKQEIEHLLNKHVE